MQSNIEKEDVRFIIYQMGKVGSTTIKKGLERTYGRERVLHTHSHEQAREYITKWSQNSDEVIVITGFREPLSRCISAYFQNLTNDKSHWFLGTKEEVQEKSIDFLISDFNVKVVPHIQQIVYPWIANYENVTKCKMEEFNIEKSYYLSNLGNVYFYIYKLEHLVDFYTDNPLFKDVNFININVSEDKWYASIYRSFKQSFKINQNDYNSLYGHIDFFCYLYDENEIKTLTKKYILE